MIKRPIRTLKRKNPETLTKNIQKNINSFIGEFVGVYGPNIHFHGKLKESDDSKYDRSEGLIKEPNEYHIQIDDGRSHGFRHWDLTSGNILISKDLKRVYFIDPFLP